MCEEASKACGSSMRRGFGSWMHAGFGSHDISFWGGVAILTNTILGSGMSQIPGLVQSAGWLVPTFAFLAFAALSTVAALLLSKTVTAIPGNADLSQRVEYSLLLSSHLGNVTRWVALSALILSFIAQNVSNVVVSAQVADGMFMQLAGKTCGLSFGGGGAKTGWLCIDEDITPDQVEDSPFGKDVYVLCRRCFTNSTAFISFAGFQCGFSDRRCFSHCCLCFHMDCAVLCAWAK